MRPRLLVIDDDLEIGQVLVTSLGSDFEVTLATTIDEAKRITSGETFHLILLDVNLPDGSGFSLFRQLTPLKIPIIFLTASDSSDDKVFGLSLEPADYVTKPFCLDELKARILLRLKKPSKERISRHGDLVFDLDRFSLKMGEKLESVSLTQTEYRLLLHLVSHEGRVFSREELIQSVWKDDVHVSDRVIDSHINQIRKKVGKSRGKIEAVYGVGYRWKYESTY